MTANPGNLSLARRTSTALILLGAALAACDNRAPPDESGPAAPPPPEIANAAVPSGVDEAALIERARTALATAIFHADTARLTNVREGSLGSVCGEVARPLGGGRFGEPLPFLVTRGGVAMVSSTPTVNLRDPDDLFPDVYVQMCASPAELTGMVAEMDGAALEPPPPLEPFAPPEPPAASAPDQPPAPVPGAVPPPTSPRPTAPPSTGPISNFSDAVIRPDQRR